VPDPADAPPADGAASLVPPDRDEAVRAFLPAVRFHAGALKLRLPSHIEMDDLVSSGILGLLDALDRFDPSRGIRFRTFAEFRIRGAMLDYLREMDWFPRSARRRAGQLQDAYSRLEGELGRPPEEEEVASRLGISREELRRELSAAAGMGIFSLDAPANEEVERKIRKALAEAALDESKERELLAETREVLGRAIDQLPERERHLVALYYYEELTMKEIGRLLGLGEPRICQLHGQAILRLRGKLRLP
jgi:RNA polymerase sigma factor for flagellar operon FliA